MTGLPGVGWQSDPDGVYQFRYHDGNDWTPYVANAGGEVCLAPRSASTPADSNPAALPGIHPAPEQEDAEWLAQVGHAYAGACIGVLDDAGATLEVANFVRSARRKAEERPQHEQSIQVFMSLAKNKEREFGPLIDEFRRTLAVARACGNELHTSSSTLDDADRWLLEPLDMETYPQVGAAVEYLRHDFPPTVEGFLQAVQQVNDIVTSAPYYGDPNCPGNIYYDQEPEDIS